MITKTRTIKARETWLKCYEDLGSVSKVARKCGIPRSTLYRWLKRVQSEGKKGLEGRSKRQKTYQKQKVNMELVELIKSIRGQFNFGPQSISTHLSRVHNIEISGPTIWRVLKTNGLPNIKKYRKHGDLIRYIRPIQGDRVQIDVTKIGPKCYQFTTIDDCTRLRTLRLYPIKKAQSTVDFLGHILNTFQFPIHRIQTDWGTEFFNETVQEELMQHFIKFRPIKPRSPHLNGKVERSQLTDKAEFYSTIPRKERTLSLASKLLEWQNFYNYIRPHASLKGKTPYEKLLSVEHLIPIQPDVTSKYWEKEEEIHSRNSTWYYRRK